MQCCEARVCACRYSIERVDEVDITRALKPASVSSPMLATRSHTPVDALFTSSSILTHAHLARHARAHACTTVVQAPHSHTGPAHAQARRAQARRVRTHVHIRTRTHAYGAARARTTFACVCACICAHRLRARLITRAHTRTDSLRFHTIMR
eukprot:6199279-Pleurochrysis_carterae.AAC.4